MSNEVNPPWALQTSGLKHNAKLARRILAGIISEGVTAFNTGGDLKVTSSGGMTVSVARGGAWVQGDDNTDQGVYFVYNSAASTLTLNNGSSQDRIDIIQYHVKDNSEGQAGDTSVLEIKQGTPGGSPTEPNADSTAIKLAAIYVTALTSSITGANITDKRKFTSLIGGNTGAPTVRVNRSGSQQNLPDSTDTGVNFDTVEFDFSTAFWAGGQPSRLTVPTGYGGKYFISANISIDTQNPAVGSRRNIKLWKGSVGGGTLLAEDQRTQSIASSQKTFSGVQDECLHICTIASLAEGDFVQVSGYQDEGVTLHFDNFASGGGLHMEILKVA